MSLHSCDKRLENTGVKSSDTNSLCVQQPVITVHPYRKSFVFFCVLTWEFKRIYFYGSINWSVNEELGENSHQKNVYFLHPKSISMPFSLFPT